MRAASAQTLKVLAAFLADATGDHYGLEIARNAGLATGTIYPILTRLERRGWVTSAWEERDPSDAGRPRRRYYRLTAEGMRAARAEIAEAHATFSRALGTTGPQPLPGAAAA